MSINLKSAVEEKLRQMNAKIEWHKDQVKLINDAKRYWKNLLQEVEKLTAKKEFSTNV